MRGPGVKSNEKSTDIVVNIDLAPTIVEMGGGKMNSVDGVSFLPSILENKSTKQFVESKLLGKRRFDMRGENVGRGHA